MMHGISPLRSKKRCWDPNTRFSAEHPPVSDPAQISAFGTSAASGDLTTRENAGRSRLGICRDRVSRPRASWACSKLLDAYREWASKWCKRCGRVRLNGSDVEVKTRDGRAHFHGLMRCGLVWECPLCQVVIKTARAEEVTRVVEWHVGQYGQDCAAMLTNTIRHGAGDSLEAVRRGLSKAWRYVQAGRGWVDARKDYGLVGYIRAMEPTHGRKNGWHPHLHIVLLTKRPLPDSFRRWVLARWQRAVERTLGPEHMPDNRHGCDLSPLHSVDYIQKLGLEVAAPNKEGRGENRTPLQILRAFAEDGDLDALNVWQSYVVGMKGARMLTWSRGLKEAAGA